MKKIHYLIFMLCALPFCVQAQQVTIRGRVTDSATGKAVSHASVVLQNENNKFTGTLTDDDGQYSITANDSATEIVFSFVGMGEVTEQINHRSVINAVLNGSASSLGDVVVSDTVHKPRER